MLYTTVHFYVTLFELPLLWIILAPMNSKITAVMKVIFHTMSFCHELGLRCILQPEFKRTSILSFQWYDSEPSWANSFKLAYCVLQLLLWPAEEKVIFIVLGIRACNSLGTERGLLFCSD